MPRIAARTNPFDIVADSCRAARELTNATHAIGSYVVSSRPWQQGVHLVVRDAPQPLVGPALSALFALHRKVLSARQPVAIEGPAHATLIEGLRRGVAPHLGPAVRAAYALPLMVRTGRIIGELVLVGENTDGWHEVLPSLEHLAGLTTVALENAQRLAVARRAQDRLLLFAEATGEALWDWNVETGEVWWGGGIHNLLGSGAEPIGPSIEWRRALIHPDEIDRVRGSMEAALRSPSAAAWNETYRFRRTDGSWAHVDDRAYFLRDADGRAYRVIGAMRDVSELRATHAALRENEERLRGALAEAQVASRVKDEFLAMLGHELRNPLSPMLVALKLMRTRGGPSRELEVLDRQMDHLTRLVDDLLDVSRITRGKITLRREPVDLADVIARAVEIASPLLEHRSHELRVQAPRGHVVHVDPARMAQVLSNLLTNAAKYSDAGSTIRLEVTGGEARVKVRVIDEGVGIEPTMLDQVFQLFVQQPQTLDRSQGGLGLGLAIVKSLVELHGGTVVAHSAGVGRGSEFTIDLPVAEAVTAPPPPPQCAAAGVRRRAGRCRILVVDDNHDGAGMLKELLEHMGHEVAVAHDGPTAVDVAVGFDPSIVLLDIGLPVMDGYEVAGLLREQRGGRPLYLIAITGYGQPEDKRRTKAAGFAAHLVKPIDVDTLMQAVDRAEEATEESPAPAADGAAA